MNNFGAIRRFTARIDVSERDVLWYGKTCHELAELFAAQKWPGRRIVIRHGGYDFKERADVFWATVTVKGGDVECGVNQ